MPEIRIEWTELARRDVRGLDRTVAMRIFEAILRFAQTGHGDVVRLDGPLAGKLRLRAGDYRSLFKLNGTTMRVLGVSHRSSAYQ